jgi:hypothetical protein
MTDDKRPRLKSIRERLDAATPGPWHFDIGNFEVEKVPCRAHICFVENRAERPRESDYIADGELIANAPSDLQYLLDLYEQLKADADKLVEALSIYAALEKSCTEIAGEPFHGDLATKALAEWRAKWGEK